MLPVYIINPETGIKVSSWGLIDTGADNCAIPAQHAPILGHNLTAGTIRQIRTGNGITNTYAHTTRIEIMAIGDATEKVVHTTTDAPVIFMPNLNVVILGAEGFLSQFILTIDYPRKVFSLKSPKK